MKRQGSRGSPEVSIWGTAEKPQQAGERLEPEGGTTAWDQMVAGVVFPTEEFECYPQGRGEPQVVRRVLERLLCRCVPEVGGRVSRGVSLFHSQSRV